MQQSLESHAARHPPRCDEVHARGANRIAKNLSGSERPMSARAALHRAPVAAPRHRALRGVQPPAAQPPACGRQLPGCAAMAWKSTLRFSWPISVTTATTAAASPAVHASASA